MAKESHGRSRDGAPTLQHVHETGSVVQRDQKVHALLGRKNLRPRNRKGRSAWSHTCPAFPAAPLSIRMWRPSTRCVRETRLPDLHKSGDHHAMLRRMLVHYYTKYRLDIWFYVLGSNFIPTSLFVSYNVSRCVSSSNDNIPLYHSFSFSIWMHTMTRYILYYLLFCIKWVMQTSFIVFFT